MTLIVQLICNNLKTSTVKLRQSSINFYIRYLNHHCPDTVDQVVVCQDTAISLQGHMLLMQILNYQPLHCQHLKVTHAADYITDKHSMH